MSVNTDLAPLFLFSIFALVIFLGAIIVSNFLQPKRPTSEKVMPYECGEVPSGTTDLPVNTRFYLIALLFLVFEVEIVLLTPVLIILKNLDVTNLKVATLSVMTFISILLLGLSYNWYMGDLNWLQKLSGRNRRNS